MTRYTELRHAGYFADGLTDAQRAAIEKEVDKPSTTTTSSSSTTSKTTTRRTSKPRSKPRK